MDRIVCAVPASEVDVNTFSKIGEYLASSKVVLFIKGTRDFPQCGFSASVVDALNQCGVDFVDFNVLADDDLRSGLKRYADWPTFPQLYVDGELVGGADIVSQMLESGELADLV